MTANAITTEMLVNVAREARDAGHGGKSEIYARAARQLGVSPATLQRHLKKVAARPPRKRRVDAGRVLMPREEALMVSSLILESSRQNEKRLLSVEDAVDILRANGEILAGRVDEDTGEFKPLSISTIRRALYAYNVHPDQLSRPTPKISLASLHPNHFWQIDPSLCVMYYLPRQKEAGLQVMPHDEYYKNKISKLARIENDRVWRYVIVDHTSGCIYVEYVLGAESGLNLSNCFINAMQRRSNQDPFSGAPFNVMVDPGSANTGAVFRNLCSAMGIRLHINKPGQPWAKGSVEQANNLIERKFEQGLKHRRVTSLDELNAHAWNWMRAFNATATHSRHAQTRYAMWQTISAEHYRPVPAVEVLREFAVAAPEERTVNAHLTVSYRGQEYYVGHVPGVIVGDRLQITRNAWRDADSAQVCLFDAEGRQVFHVVEAIAKNEYGFRESDYTAVLGQSYRAHRVTPAERAREEVEKLVTGTESLDEAKAKRKSKALPYDGRIDPWKPTRDTPLPSWMPKKGTALDIASPVIETPPLSHFAAAKRLKPVLGALWTQDSYAWMQRTYPDGVREEQLDEIISTIKKQHAGTGLRVVGGA